MINNSVDAFCVRTLELGGLGAALQALRLPFMKECRSIVDFHSASFSPVMEQRDESDKFFDGRSHESIVLLSEKDRTLLSTLIRRGDEHAKVLRGVMVWCEINAPRYWWQEMATYRIGTECLSSESTMHVEGRGLDEDSLVELKEHIEEGHMQKRIYIFSYQTLRRIYFQRRNHRLPQWRKFCEWIDTLPFANAFITVDGKDTDRDEQVSDADNR